MQGPRLLNHPWGRWTSREMPFLPSFSVVALRVIAPNYKALRRRPRQVAVPGRRGPSLVAGCLCAWDPRRRGAQGYPFCLSFYFCGGHPLVHHLYTSTCPRCTMVTCFNSSCCLLPALLFTVFCCDVYNTEKSLLCVCVRLT